MKKALLLILTFAGMAMVQSVFATHIKAVSMHYNCVAGDTLEMNVVQQQDCGGLLPSPGLVQFTGVGPGCTPPAQINSWTIKTSVDVTPVCAGVVTNCTSPGMGVAGYAERIFSTEYDFSSATCTQYEARWSLCCRQPTTSYSHSPADIILDGVMIDLSNTPCNNSPQFINPPTMWLCSGVDAVFENQTYDPDGDSLVYRIIDCNGGPAGPVGYKPGYSANAPLGTGWTMSLDPVTGNITFTASPGGVEAGYVCLEVMEYRNGVQIGATVVDFKVDVLACTGGNNDIPVVDSLHILQNGQLTGVYEIDVFQGDTVVFGLIGSDVNTGDTLTTRLDTAGRVSGATLNTNGINSQTITISWPADSLGRQDIRLFTYDNHCPIPGGAWRTVTINVISTPPPLSAFFPGDANLDGRVDQTDILALGLGFNTLGPAIITPPFDTTWMAFNRSPWTNSFIFGGNYAYADCDANGSIDAADKDIVNMHFGQSHMQGNYTPAIISGANVPMSVVVDADTFAGGDSIEARVELGTMALPAIGVYGVSFVLTYDTAFVDSFIISTSFANSWLGPQANLLTFDKQLVADGKLAIAVSRTDQQPITGFGTLADVIIIVDDVAGKKEEYLDIKLSLSEVTLITETGEQFGNVATTDAEFVVTRAVTGLGSAFDSKAFTIFPQPASSGPVFISLNETTQGPINIQVYDMGGKKMYNQTVFRTEETIKLAGSENWRSGIYLINIQADDRHWAGKVVK